MRGSEGRSVCLKKGLQTSILPQPFAMPTKAAYAQVALVHTDLDREWLHNRPLNRIGDLTQASKQGGMRGLSECLGREV